MKILWGDRQQTDPVLWRCLLGLTLTLGLCLPASCGRWVLAECLFPARPAVLTQRCWIIIKGYLSYHPGPPRRSNSRCDSVCLLCSFCFLCCTSEQKQFSQVCFTVSCRWIFCGWSWCWNFIYGNIVLIWSLISMYVLPNDGLSNFQAYLPLNFLLQPSARWGTWRRWKVRVVFSSWLGLACWVTDVQAMI